MSDEVVVRVTGLRCEEQMQALAACTLARCGARSPARSLTPAALSLLWDSLTRGERCITPLRLVIRRRPASVRTPARAPHALRLAVCPLLGSLLLPLPRPPLAPFPRNAEGVVGGPGSVLLRDLGGAHCCTRVGVHSRWVLRGFSGPGWNLVIEPVPGAASYLLRDMDDPEVGVSVPGLCCGDSRFCGVFCDRERCDDALILHCHDGQIVPSGVSCITLTLVDIRKTYVTKSLSTIVQLQCPLPSSQFQLFPTLDELMCATGVVMRKGTATGTLVFVMQIEAKVFLIEQKSEEPSIATASVIALDCSSLSHVSGSFFCIAYNNEVTCELWDCNQNTSSILTPVRVIRCDDGEVFRQVVGGSGMLFTVCESKNRGNSQNSNGNRVVITDAFTGHHVATVEVVTNGQPDSVYLDDMASLL